MFHQTNRPSLQSSHKILCILTVHLLLTHSCRGQSQLIGSSQPIVATVGDDIILPCQLQPAEDVAALAVEWTRSDLDSIYVHVRRAGQEVITAKHESYQGRTSVSIDGLKQGNISLKLSKVKLSDEGKYRCFILQLDTQSFVELVVASDAVSPPVISVAGIDRVRGEVVLQCGSKGWYPEPEVFWLDSEENFLSAGPTETVRGPDDLYTVSSKVTVEKRLNNNFTCRVKQNKINQIRETHFIVPDDFFKALPSSSPVIIGVAVSLGVCVVVVVAVFFFVWKRKQNKIKETEGGDPEMQPLKGTDGKTLTTQAGKNSTESPVNVEVSPSGIFIRLTNKSKEDLKLEGWKLRVKVSDQNPIMFTFKESFILNAGKKVTIWAFGCGTHFPGPSDLQWNDLKRWTKGDKLLVELINCDGEIVTTIKEDKNPTGNSNPEPISTPDENDNSHTSSQLEEKPEEGDERKTDEGEQEKKKNETLEKTLQESEKQLEAQKEEGDKCPSREDPNPESNSTPEENNDSNNQEDKSRSGGNSIPEPISTPEENNDSNTSSQSEEKPEEGDQRKTDEEEQEKKETQRASKNNDTNLADQNSTEVFVEVDPNGKCIRLFNESKEDLKLEGWKLRVKLNNQNPIMFTFEKSIILRAEMSVNIWADGCGFRHPPSDLKWKDLNRWTKGDKLLVELINCDEEIVKTTEV